MYLSFRTTPLINEGGIHGDAIRYAAAPTAAVVSQVRHRIPSPRESSQAVAAIASDAAPSQLVSATAA